MTCVDPDPELESGSGSMGKKNEDKNAQVFLAFIIQNFEKNLSSKFPLWIRIEEKCWIRMESIRIHNPDFYTLQFFVYI
jgi:hypothetical protein